MIAVALAFDHQPVVMPVRIGILTVAGMFDQKGMCLRKCGAPVVATCQVQPIGIKPALLDHREFTFCRTQFREEGLECGAIGIGIEVVFIGDQKVGEMDLILKIGVFKMSWRT